MSKTSLFCLFVLIPTVCLSQVIWFSDSFQEPRLRPQWDRVDSSWHVHDGVLSVNTKAYDNLLSSHFYAYATQRFSFEVTLRGIRAGVFFNLDNTGSKTLSHMVRFDEKSILAGYFDGGGEFTATSVYDVPKLPTDWTTLRIDVDPVAKLYSIYVDDLFLGADTNLVFSSGYIGLQASDGLCEFKSVKVYSNLPPLPPQLPQLGSELSFLHVSHIQSKGEDLEIYVPELHRLVRLDLDGHWLAVQKPKDEPTLTVRVVYGNKTFTISNKHIIVRSLSGSVVDSIVEHLVAPSELLLMRSILYVADPGAKAVFQFSSEGRLIGKIDASLIGGFKAPRGIMALSNSQLVIADYDRLVFWDESASHLPIITFGPEGRKGQISWKSNSNTLGWLEFGFEDQGWDRISSLKSPSASAARTVELKNLKPLTRYALRYGPTLKTIPQAASASKLLRFSTPPSKKAMMPISRLPILCMVYRTISYRDKYPRQLYPQIPDGNTLSDDDTAYLRRATEFNREFYFRNSGSRMVLDFDFFVVDDTLWLHEVGDANPY